MEWLPIPPVCVKPRRPRAAVHQQSQEHGVTIPQLSRRTSVRRPSIQTLARHGPRLANEVRRYLDVPRPYREVEELVGAARDVEARPRRLGDEVSELEECCLFFSHLGFLHKYKVYGVKIALPFGYSLFDLADGAGFSFQVHEQPKLEGFHVLRTKNSSLLFICDRDEWEAEGRSWAVRRFGDGDCGVLPAGALVPLEGDVAAVSETNIVHTVLGCVLEEYASCSVDSVVRLHDQNDRSDPVLPKRHPSTAALVASGSTGLPRRHLSRDRTGWATRIPTSSGEILDAPGQRMACPHRSGYPVRRRPGARGHVGGGRLGLASGIDPAHHVRARTR